MRFFAACASIFLVGLSAVVCEAKTKRESFIVAASKAHGTWGERAARFLVEHMPASDVTTLSDSYLLENLKYASLARERFPWSKDFSEELFFNDVLPYAVFDEPRDPWRADFYQLAGELVEGAGTAGEAAQILNRELFDRINTHYDKRRARANQSPAESIKQGRASCTGLSILLVCACRSVGIPARAVGTPIWWNESGNHTWVEIWDGDWSFTGADEFDKQGLNRGWFVKNASRADPSDLRKAIYATSWKGDDLTFPMAWSPRSKEVAAVNVTSRYAGIQTDKGPSIGVRLSHGNRRLATRGWLTKVSGVPLHSFETKAGSADHNDTARVPAELGGSYRWRFVVDGSEMESGVFRVDEGDRDIRDVAVGDLKPAPDFSDPKRPLGKEEAKRAVAYVYDEMIKHQSSSMASEMKAKETVFGEHKMRWLEKTFGKAPAGKRSLWISMHGGGGAPKQVNDQQWFNQIRLYQPKEGIYVAPRAPTDSWNLWHQGHIDPLFSRLIEAMVALRGVDPNRVYVMGYSAGGDGVWQLAPRMADRFAAAAMMAGHPNESQLYGLRNLPFAIYMGANDNAYDRAKIAAKKAEELAILQKEDPKGYEHRSRIFPGMGHWMNRKDAEALPWMAKFERNPWPEKIVWFQDDVTHDRFYWLCLAAGTAKKGQEIEALLEGRTFTISGDVPKGAKLVLSDELLDLDEPVSIKVEGANVRKVRPVRTIAAIRESFEERLDPKATYTAIVPLQ